MGILLQNQPDIYHPLTEKDKCYYCGLPIIGSPKSTGGAVYWQGYAEDWDGPILLHQGCAETWALHLIQDARSLSSVVPLSWKHGEGHISTSRVWFKSPDARREANFTDAYGPDGERQAEWRKMFMLSRHVMRSSSELHRTMKDGDGVDVEQDSVDARAYDEMVEFGLLLPPVEEGPDMDVPAQYRGTSLVYTITELGHQYGSDAAAKYGKTMKRFPPDSFVI